MYDGEYAMRKFHTPRGKLVTALVHKGKDGLDMVYWVGNRPKLERGFPLSDARYLEYFTPNIPVDHGVTRFMRAKDRMDSETINFLKEAEAQS